MKTWRLYITSVCIAVSPLTSYSRLTNRDQARLKRSEQQTPELSSSEEVPTIGARGSVSSLRPTSRYYQNSKKTEVSPTPPVQDPTLKPVEASQDQSITITELEEQAPAQDIDYTQLAHLGAWVYPTPVDPNITEILFNFDEADLINIIRYIEKQYGIYIITDDIIDPVPKNGRKVAGNKITLRTYKPLDPKQAWGLFIHILDTAGFALQPSPIERTFRLIANDPKVLGKGQNIIFVGTHYDALPDTEQFITYVYFVQNTSMDVVRNVFNAFKSPNSPAFIPLEDQRAFVLIDKANQIKYMARLLEEIDADYLPEVMSVVRLRNKDAAGVVAFYDTLLKEMRGGSADTKTQPVASRVKKNSGFFIGDIRISGDVRMIAEPRTNSVVLLGVREEVAQLERFILEKFDSQAEKPFTPIHVYRLKHVDADAAASILQNILKFKQESDVAKFGGVRSGERYIKQASIIPEKSGNQLIITAHHEDYLALVDILKDIDIEQPQVAIKVLVISVDVTDIKELGTQFRDRTPTLDSTLNNGNINFQTSGLGGRPVVENTAANTTGAVRLLGNLISLAQNVATPGTTWLALGSDAFGVWGMLRALESYTHINVLEQPFLMTVNKSPAVITSGETRRVQTATVFNGDSVGTQAFDDLSAQLSLKITPTISYEGFVTLDVDLNIAQFTGQDGTISAGNRIERKLATSVILEDKGILALGGLIREKTDQSMTKVPLFGDIPILGWLGKNKSRRIEKNALVVLISPEIVPVNDRDVSDRLTLKKLYDVNEMLTRNKSTSVARDPIHRSFFNDQTNMSRMKIEEFFKKENRYLDPSVAEALGRERGESKSLLEYLQPQERR